MGFYLNPGNKRFWESIRSEIYVDKTGLIADTNKYINTEQKFLCVSRPRRFGKSMALKMLAAYYSRDCESAALFLQQFLIRTGKNGDVTEYLERAVMEELRETYGSLISGQIIILSEALEKIYAKTEKQFIFLIDEWDCVMRERQESETL